MNGRTPCLPQLLALHAEELAFLWERRCAMLYASEGFVCKLSDVGERIEAHLQGLAAGGAQALPVLEPLLASPERGEAFAGASALLRLGGRHEGQVLGAFAAAKGEGLAGLRDALCLPRTGIEAQALRAILDIGDAEHAVAAAVVLAAKGWLDPADARCCALLQDASPALRETLWKVAARIDVRAHTKVARPYRDAVLDQEAGVRSAALGAALWRAEPWAERVVRQMAQAGDAVGLQWLAAIGEASDLPVLAAAVADGARGPDRLEYAGRFGHPELLEMLVACMDEEDVNTSARAGAVFARITGFEVQGERVTLPVAPDADDFEKEFAPQLWRGDAARARALVLRNRARWFAGVRWCRGCEISVRLDRNGQERIDLQAFWDWATRAAFSGAPAFGLPYPV